MSIGNKGGRPVKFKSPEDMQTAIDKYFDSCFAEVKGKLERVRPYTITGLAIALDTTRETLLDYQHKKEFSDTIRKAKLRCENFVEEQLFTGKQVAGPIFNLKNNYGWQDKQELNIPGGIEINWADK